MSPGKKSRGRAVFLDRDGVIIEEVHYLRRSEEIRLIAGAAGAISRLRRAGFKIIVVSNQSGVARGYVTRTGVERIHRDLRRRLRLRGAKIDALYYCPHHPLFSKGRPCLCRKPALGMLRTAVRRFSLDLAGSFLVGDTTTDVRTARNAGCRAILVRSGYGGKDGKYKVRPDAVCRDLPAASAWILARA